MEWRMSRLWGSRLSPLRCRFICGDRYSLQRRPRPARFRAPVARRRRQVRGLWTMCGIFGAIARREAALRHPEALTRMAAALRHRGPDGECIIGHERARIGARRLAIMDLTTGDQPFQSPD